MLGSEAVPDRDCVFFFFLFIINIEIPTDPPPLFEQGLSGDWSLLSFKSAFILSVY